MSKYRIKDLESIANMFKALSSPQRLRIFLTLASDCARGNCCAGKGGLRRTVGDLGSGLDLASSTVSHHLKELKNSGLMKVERRGRKVECYVDEKTLNRLSAILDYEVESGTKKK